MDAQNAVENASTKPAASSPKQPASEPGQHPSKPAPSRRSPTIVRSSPPVRDSKSHAPDDDGGADANSEAETIVLAKDGPSPAKPRKPLKHEARSDGEDASPGVAATRKQSVAGKDKDARDGKDGRDGREGRDGRDGRDGGHRPHKAGTARDNAAATSDAGPLKKKRPQPGPERHQRNKTDCSSGLSSAPASPPPTSAAHPASHHAPNQQQPLRRRRLSAARSASESDSIRAQSPKPPAVVTDKSRSVDKLVPHKRKAPKAESEDEADRHKARRQRTNAAAAAGVESAKTGRDHGGSNHGHGHGPSKSTTSTTKAHHDPHPSAPISASTGTSTVASRTRSASPPPRAHRRSISSQLPSQSSNGLSHKKKRVPAPLQSTEYHSDESSASGSPRMRSSKMRSLTTPATTESNISPARIAPHKKHLDAHGQTFLARACARGEYEVAKQRLGERPEDLNVADFAGNTPLQIAAINGYEDIVKLLLDAGCALDCVNYDKDTPLLDAVENGHVQVVKLLLEAGVNPRKANVNGVEPLDRIVDNSDESIEIKKLLTVAKQRMGDRRRTSEEHHHRTNDGRESHGPESPRHSPATAAAPQSAASSRRTATVRATKTSNHLLYMPMDDKTLRQAAGRGDEETVTRILQVRDTFDDPESMVAAARGGHDMIINLLLALGNANPDPPPVASMTPEVATPMLAAIGQENIKVVELLLSQGSFDPTRRFQGQTYYELARKRQGPNWKDEEQMLKDAYDAHKKSHKDSKTKSPAAREQERESKRAARPPDHAREETANANKRKTSSPPKEVSRETKKGATGKAAPSSPKEKRRSNSFTAHRDDQASPKRGPGRPKKEDRLPTISVVDRESSPSVPKQPSKTKRAESDLAAMSSEGEAVKPRRKLVSGKELKGEREKQRRASLVSTASSMKEPPSPRDPRDDASEKPKAEKFLDRTKQLRRDESRDRLSVSGESTGKRHRLSATPPHAHSEKEAGEAPIKRRKLDVDGKEKRQKPSTSPDDRHHKTASSHDAPPKARKDPKDPKDPKDQKDHKDLKDVKDRKSAKERKEKDHENEERKEPTKPRKSDSSADHSRRESAKSTTTEKSIHVKSEDPDVEMRDVDLAAEVTEARALKTKEERRKQAEAASAAAAAAALSAKKEEEEEEERQKVEEEKRKQEEERERKRREDDERRRREEEEAEKKRKAEADKKRLEEEAAKRKEEEEAARKRREEEERKRVEEEEKKRKAEEEQEKLRLEREEQERKRREAEALKQREEEERQRKEQLEKEAAEQARRKEEEDRKEQERLREMERRRAAREAEQRRLFQQTLPPLLRWLDCCPQPKTSEVAQKFSTMQGVRYDCIRPEATGTADGREQWLLNTQVALLLGEKDLKLARYTAWEKVPVSGIAKIMIWRIEADRYALTSPSLYELGSQLPGYYGDKDPERMNYKTIEKLRSEAWTKFQDMDMFFVKASDLMFIIPTIPHLRNIKLTMAYKELPEDGSLKWQSSQKWKIDPDANRFYGFAPGNKYYVNGSLVHEQTPGLSPVSKTPFPEHRVPRRNGLVAVTPDDPEYAHLCREQGLNHLLGTASPQSYTHSPSTPRLPNGLASSSPATAHVMNHTANGGLSPKDVASSSVVNGNGNGIGIGIDANHVSPAASSTATATAATPGDAARTSQQPLVNGLSRGPPTNGAGN